MRTCLYGNPSLIFACILVLERTVHTALSNSDAFNIESCDDLTPGSDVEAENDPLAFTIVTEVQTLDACDRLKVSLEAAEDAFFNGFIIQARSESTQEVVGTFSLSSGSLELGLTYLDCGDGISYTVSYEAPIEIDVAHLDWTPGEGFSGNVYFVASFVKNITTFWTNITSQLVTVSNKGKDCYLQDILGTLEDRVDQLTEPPCNSSTCTVNRLPGNFCNSSISCIEGLECRDSRCACPLPCVYVANISSCDCGQAPLDYGGPIIVGVIAGSIIIALWYWIIKQTIANYKTSKGRVYNNGNRRRPAPVQHIQHFDEFNQYMQSNRNNRMQNNMGNSVQNPNYDYQNMNFNNQHSYPRVQNVPYSTNLQNHPNSIHNPPYPTVQNVPYSANLQSHPNSSIQNYAGYPGSMPAQGPNYSNIGTSHNNSPIDSERVVNTHGASATSQSSRPESTASMLTSHSGTSYAYPLSQNLAVAPLEPLKPLAPINSNLGFI